MCITNILSPGTKPNSKVRASVGPWGDPSCGRRERGLLTSGWARPTSGTARFSLSRLPTSLLFLSHDVSVLPTSQQGVIILQISEHSVSLFKRGCTQWPLSKEHSSERSNLTVEEPAKGYLSQVVKAIISSDKSCWQYVPSIWCDGNGHFTAVVFLAQNP